MVLDWSPKIIGSSVQAGHQFGEAVALRGKRLWVGAPGAIYADDINGEVYIFEVNSAGTWQQVSSLRGPKDWKYAWFGHGVTMADTYVAISQITSTTLFEQVAKGSWTTLKAVQNLSPFPSNKIVGHRFAPFGVDLVATDNRVFMGWSIMEQQPSGSGQIDVFSRQPNGSWSKTQTLFATGAKEGDHFGASISVDGNWIAAGAPRRSTKGKNAGAVYAFKLASSGANSGLWQQTQKIVADQGRAEDRFGVAVAVGDGKLLVGAPGVDRGGMSSGAVYAYRLTNNGVWQFIGQVNGGSVHEQLGTSLAIDGSDWFVGAPGTNSFSGAVKVFRLESLTCDSSGACSCKPGFSGKKCGN